MAGVLQAARAAIAKSPCPGRWIGSRAIGELHVETGGHRGKGSIGRWTCHRDRHAHGVAAAGTRADEADVIGAKGGVGVAGTQCCARAAVAKVPEVTRAACRLVAEVHGVQAGICGKRSREGTGIAADIDPDHEFTQVVVPEA